MEPWGKAALSYAIAPRQACRPARDPALAAPEPARCCPAAAHSLPQPP
jgi:hypothetical protein